MLGAKEFFTSFLIAIPFMHYLLLQTFRVMVTLPLNQNEAGLLTSLVPGVCDGTIKNIYFQGFFSQVCVCVCAEVTDGIAPCIDSPFP